MSRRKLNFDSAADSTRDFEKDSNFPIEWKINGENIEQRIQKLNEELRAQGHSSVSNPSVDPKSKFRTEYRRILNAHTIISDALRVQKKEIDWFKNATELLSVDLEALQNRREHVDKVVRDLRDQLGRIDSTVGILKSQQLAVKSVLELREDEYMDDDGDSNMQKDYEKFGKISKLCDIALKQYEIVKKRNEEMQKWLIAERNRQRKHHEATMKLLEDKERARVEALNDMFKNASLEQLQKLRDSIRKAKN